MYSIQWFQKIQSTVQIFLFSFNTKFKCHGESLKYQRTTLGKMTLVFVIIKKNQVIVIYIFEYFSNLPELLKSESVFSLFVCLFASFFPFFFFSSFFFCATHQKSTQNMVNPITHTYTLLQASSEVLHGPPYKDFSDIVGDSFPVLGSPSYKRKTKSILIPGS